MIEVIQAGLETSVQDYPGRIGYWNQGFPPSGPMDSWSFRLANLLVGNEPGAAGLECQFMGPTLKFRKNTVIAVCGADMKPKLEGQPMPTWESVAVSAGQTLQLSFPSVGARGYIAIAGGIATPPWLGSRSTFHKAGVGGMEGHALKVGQIVPVAQGRGKGGRKVKDGSRPTFSANKHWTIEVVAGPNDDWVDEAGHARFLATDWKLSSKSDRTGFRLEGPMWTFAEKATNKRPEHGAEPSNIIDQGYPVGAINLAGQTPIILVNDGPSMGGFINPYTVPSAAFWKLGQSRPGETYRFHKVTVEQAQAMGRDLKAICSENSIY
ncbi:biotin-dependent carboxyltransferase family protein [Candidatus Deferrimicrobium sp.]|uniref:5-oxoprolinase subunit C family protein n=1 Tax=Candidatus Deferrimicrobium sp. TaxID=3060586 RepID=UPI003C484E0A